MEKSILKKLLMPLVLIVLAFNFLYAQETKVIKLDPPNKKRGLSVSEACALRASVRDWSDKDVDMQTLSDLLWAANGINRDNKKRTAASAMNAQDVDIYVFMKNGVYIYDAANNALNLIAGGAHIPDIAMARQGGNAVAVPNYPVDLILISDYSRFRGGSDEKKREWSAVDAGIVSQNIMLFCAANGLVTHPRASINEPNMKKLLALKDTQICLLELPIGYPKQ